MKKLYKVNYGHDLNGREKNKRFYTLSAAQSFCDAYFAATRQILTIEAI